MLWERLFLLVHTEVGLSLLLCTSDTQSWAVADTPRDVDLCQKHKHTKLSQVLSCITCTDAPVHAINNIKERKGVGCVCGNNLECHPHMDAHMHKLTLNEQQHRWAYSGINSKQTQRGGRLAHTAAYIVLRMKGLGTTPIIICKFTIMGSAWLFDWARTENHLLPLSPSTFC